MLHGSRVLVAGLLLAASACGHHRGAPADSTEATATAPEVRVFVTNRYEISLEVSVSASGINHRLGVVAPGLPRNFVLPQTLMASGGQVEFLAQPSGRGPVIRSGLIQVMPGDVVDFEIATNLVGSRAVVRQ